MNRPKVAYAYVRRAYDVRPVVGERVVHQVTKRSGEIAKEDAGMAQYVMVWFDGDRHALPCHPTELAYLHYADGDY